MKEFKVNEQQLKALYELMLEIPAKHSLQYIKMLESLPLIEEKVAEPVKE